MVLIWHDAEGYAPRLVSHQFECVSVASCRREPEYQPDPIPDFDKLVFRGAYDSRDIGMHIQVR